MAAEPVPDLRAPCADPVPTPNEPATMTVNPPRSAPLPRQAATGGTRRPGSTAAPRSRRPFGAVRRWAATALFLPALLLAAASPVRAAGGAPWIAPLSSGETLPLPPLDPNLPSPADHLGYRLGEHFTRYADMRAYLERLAAASDRVELWEYGRTYLDRPLTLLALSSPANLRRLDELRRQRRRLEDPSLLSPEEREHLAETAPAVVFLAYGVHGNESSSAEAALATAYTLAAAGGRWPELLDEVVVLLDPLSNPDGRERYVAGYQQRRGRRPDPDPAAREHSEPWPGGRYNHYLIDLNRDWSWATQRETRHRLRLLATWLPQVYVDLHEMSSRATYFFPPSAEPVNPEIDERVVRWLEVFGRGNGAAFDRLGWLYYKAESFDLFYPGYADSYTSFRGAVGMTYEVGGGGRAGLVLRRDDGTHLTLADRLARHLVTSLATVETAAANRRRLLSDFLAGRLAEARRRDGPVYLWRADRPEAAALATLLGRHGIRVHRTPEAWEADARPLPPTRSDGDGARRHRFPAGTWAVPSAQPQGNLVRALLEPETPMSDEFLDEQRRRVELDLDAAFYDVTAWSLPLAFNVEAWAATAAPPRLGPPLEPPADPARDGEAPPAELAAAETEADAGTVSRGENGTAEAQGEPVGWLLPPAGLDTYRTAARLQDAGVPYRLALAELAVEGRSYPTGTLFVPRLRAPRGTAELLAGLSGGAAAARPVHTSFTDDGISLGSNRMQPIVPARIALAAGDGVRPTSLGALWHLLDRQARVGTTLVELADLGRIDLAGFDVLVLPDGWGYDRALAEEAGDAVERWVRGGGVLVVVGGAIDWLRERELTRVEEWSPDDDGAAGVRDPEMPGSPLAEAPIDRPLYVPGAVVATEMRDGHPLTAGMVSPPPALVAGTRPLLATGEPQVDVLTVSGDDPVIAGFAWPESRRRLEGSLLVATEAAGSGRVVLFAQEPGFRLFWRGTMPLFLNAVMFGPSLDARGRY